MKNTFLIYLFCFVTLSSLVSCLKEKSIENGQSAGGSLQSESSGECLNKTVAGLYTAGKTLTDSNFIEIEVDVAARGRYTITTDVVNGFSFKGTGTFTNTGINTIKLNGSGTPLTEGVNSFLVQFDSSECVISIAVLPSGSTGSSAIFTLAGAPDSCRNVTTAGSFVKGIALTSASKVNIQVNVTTPGTYNITTNSVNGYRFSGSGSFATIGNQTITLTAAGTPLLEGINTFSVVVAGTVCSFSITVTATAPPPPPPGTANHFPLTLNSRWSYDEDQDDTLGRVIIGTKSVNNGTYSEIEETDELGSKTSYFYRKAGNDYFEYTYVDEFSILSFKEDIQGDILFLKENLTSGQTWNSSEWTGTEENTGQRIKIRYVFVCTDPNFSTNVTSSAGTKTFTNVYKISFKSQIALANTINWQDEGVIWEALYANNIGLISLKGTATGVPAFTMPIRYWLIK